MLHRPLAVVQYVDLNGDYRNRLAILLTLANNCELQPFVRDANLPHQAAEYRQQLFVEMINEGELVPKKCAVCNDDMNAHKPSALPDMPKAKVMVSLCLHLFHQGCMQTLGEFAACPLCSKPIGRWKCRND